MHIRLLSLFSLLFSCTCWLQAQEVVTDRTTLLPDDIDAVEDSVVTVAPVLGEAENLTEAAVFAGSTDSVGVDMPTYLPRAVYRSWRKSHPISPLAKVSMEEPVRRFPEVDALLNELNQQSREQIHGDMLYLYDMRLPIINSGSVPVDSMMQFFEQARNLEESSDMDPLPIGHFDQRYARQRLNEEYRHLVRFRYASVDPRRFRYARRQFDVPTTESQTLDSKTTVQQTRIGDYLDLDFGKADLEMFGQYFELKADKWHWQGDHTLTMQQTAQSDNWYKGGDNNMSVSGNQKITVKRYDEEAKTTFEAVLDLKLSGYYTKADTVHSMKVSDNELSLSLKYGYKAWKKWYYSAQLYSKTPVFDYYKPNSRECKSTFLSPLELNLSLGVDYQYTSPNKRFSYSLLLAPLSYDLKAVRDDRVNVTSYGIAEGDNTLHKFGSSITTKFEWKMSDNASWSSRLYCFTPYSSVQVEFENTFNFKISRFFTARIYAYPRFDDSRDTETEIKEMLTFGFSYQW